MAYRHFIAIANEDGQIAIQNTNLPNNDSIEEQTVKGQQCHNNAVFDVEWMPGQMQLVSASGNNNRFNCSQEIGQLRWRL